MPSKDMLDPLLYEGIELFNREKFFACHEVLEKLWLAQNDPQRQFTQGMIQIAVGCYHLIHANEVGALKLLKRGLARITPFSPLFGTIHVDYLVRSVRDMINLLESKEKLKNNPVQKIPAPSPTPISLPKVYLRD